MINKLKLLTLEKICDYYYTYITKNVILDLELDKDIKDFLFLHIHKMKENLLEKEVEYLNMMKNENFFFEKCINDKMDLVLFNNVFFKLYNLYFIYLTYVINYAKNGSINNEFIDMYMKLGFLTSSMKSGSVNRIYSLNYLDFIYVLDLENKWHSNDAKEKNKILYPHGTMNIFQKNIFNFDWKNLIKNSNISDDFPLIPIILANNGITKFYISILFNWMHLESEKNILKQKQIFIMERIWDI